MTLQMWVDLAQIVSASAVTLTLLAVIMTIRQNTRSQKAVAVDSLAAAITSINVPAMKSHILGSALSKATVDWGSASREERIIAHFFLFSFFKLLENAWYQRRAGILDQAVSMFIRQLAARRHIFNIPPEMSRDQCLCGLVRLSSHTVH